MAEICIGCGLRVDPETGRLIANVEDMPEGATASEFGAVHCDSETGRLLAGTRDRYYGVSGEEFSPATIGAPQSVPANGNIDSPWSTLTVDLTNEPLDALVNLSISGIWQISTLDMLAVVYLHTQVNGGAVVPKMVHADEAIWTQPDPGPEWGHPVFRDIVVSAGIWICPAGLITTISHRLSMNNIGDNANAMGLYRLGVRYIGTVASIH